jgi:hypothetical protein
MSQEVRSAERSQVSAATNGSAPGILCDEQHKLCVAGRCEQKDNHRLGRNGHPVWRHVNLSMAGQYGIPIHDEMDLVRSLL